MYYIFWENFLDIDELSTYWVERKVLKLYELCTERIQTSMIAMNVCICSRAYERMSCE